MAITRNSVSGKMIFELLVRMSREYADGYVPYGKLLQNANTTTSALKSAVQLLVSEGVVSAKKNSRKGQSICLTGKVFDSRSEPPPIPRRIQHKDRKWFVLYKETLRCEICRESNVATIEFHHKNPAEKMWNISALVGSGASPAAVFLEIQKCQILCSNCHRKLHWEMRHAPPQ
jgi:5-methylcytosine-specific restriction endonuclease McrA